MKPEVLKAQLMLAHREFCNNRVLMTNEYNKGNMNRARWYKLKCEMDLKKMKAIKQLLLNEENLKC